MQVNCLHFLGVPRVFWGYISWHVYRRSTSNRRGADRGTGSRLSVHVLPPHGPVGLGSEGTSCHTRHIWSPYWRPHTALHVWPAPHAPWSAAHNNYRRGRAPHALWLDVSSWLAGSQTWPGSAYSASECGDGGTRPRAGWERPHCSML